MADKDCKTDVIDHSDTHKGSNVKEIAERIPRTEEQLQAALKALPVRLQIAVDRWCRGEDPSRWYNADKSKRSSYYRDRRLLSELGLDLEQPHPAPFAFIPPPRPELICYVVHVRYMSWAPFHMHALAEHHEAFLSPRGRLAGAEKRAELDSHSLARALADHCLPRMRKRYGSELELVVVECRMGLSTKAHQRVTEDSLQADAYLARNRKRSGEVES